METWNKGGKNKKKEKKRTKTMNRGWRWEIDGINHEIAKEVWF